MRMKTNDGTCGVHDHRAIPITTLLTSLDIHKFQSSAIMTIVFISTSVVQMMCPGRFQDMKQQAVRKARAPPMFETNSESLPQLSLFLSSWT